MAGILIPSYTEDRPIKEIKVDRDITIFSDSHCNIQNIKKLQELYSNNLLISLGDLTFIFSKPGETYNNRSIQFFIDNKIPVCVGNHDSYLAQELKYDISNEYREYLKSLPMGFKLLLPNGKNILAYHSKPTDLWGFHDNLSKDDFLKSYPIDKDTLFVLRGHHHRSYVLDYPEISNKLITIGRLSGESPEYAVLSGDGLEFKKL